MSGRVEHISVFGGKYDGRTWTSFDGGSVHPAIAGAGTLGASLLVSLHSFCRPEPIAIGRYELVPSDVPAEETGTAVRLKAAAEMARITVRYCGY
jgi:hypothetical protein